MHRDLLNSLNVGVLALDRERRVAVWNAWLAGATGLSEAHALGHTLSELFPGADLSKLDRAAREAAQSGASRLLSHALHPGLLPLRTRADRPMLHDIVVGPVGEPPFALTFVQITDVTVAAERERVLRERQNARYAAVVDNARDGILTVDETGIVQHVNAAAGRQFGVEAVSLVGASVTSLFEHGQAWEQVWRNAIGGRGKDERTELIVRRPDGSTSYLEASASRWQSQTQAYASVILRDVSERHATDAALRQLNDDTSASLLDERRVSELREQFIAVLGHDLRNPLASIDSGIRILLRDPANERARTISTMMQQSVLRMASLIDNVLDFARGRLGGGIALRLRPERIEPVLEQVVAELRSTWPDREIQTTWALPDPIVCDITRLAQLFSNLLGNALTHGAKDGPIVVLATHNYGEFELSVSNPGDDIAAATLERLFQPFSRGGVTPNKQGLGLGLFISSEIAKAHGGVLRATSTQKTVRFIFIMPAN